MRILLVHKNFPGQFRYLAPALTKAGHKVGVLTWENNKNPRSLPTAEYKYQPRKTKGLSGFYTDNVENGAAAAMRAWQLSKAGDAPDVVFGSINWGETLFLKEVWPSARLLGYAEFLYATEGRDTGFDPEFSRETPESKIRTIARTGHLVLAATRADALLSPTKWQASTFPDELQSKISVIHDGVDTDRIAPDPSAQYQVPGGPLLTAKDEVITFVNRNLEPYRGYHIFMRALPKLMAQRPNLRVVLVGGNGSGYGPTHASGKSWKDIFLEEVSDRVDHSRLHFTGRVLYSDLLNILRIGRAHLYLTYPFVLSWSMLEAMSLGCVVVGSATAPVQEVIQDRVNGHLVDFFDHEALADRLAEICANPDAQQGIRAQARQHIIDTYDLRRVCLPQLMDFVETAGA
ncbi:putative glycosyltransferase [Candidatus Rhodobacter oscarellae]|uniref:Putative glycosyltransferase n=1 Tax=Candidatus Rhodobacter oscarellae TaxID=1675527 RepID=A0A0J9H2A8_9RHOB|nr:glycosyltransferase [Candidatus Rhodobacter lobularis]KMW59838.1 putative glycosyltransferase [Candidatus Rhodobacter lobularis]